MRPLQISFGSTHFSYVDRVETLTWDEFCAKLTANVPQTSDKASVGWYACAPFADNYRDEEHIGGREVLTFDFDHITPADVERITKAYESFEYLIYTTHSHTRNNPRLRLLMPLDRPCTPDEFRAVSRAVADLVGIELVAPESHKPAQFMFMPATTKQAKFRSQRNAGAWVDVDGTLSTYDDWTDRKQWPVAKNDTTYKSDELPTPAREKPGIIGAFNRVYTITQAIEAFDLPYEKVSETRWTYTKGSRPEGARTYDDDTKLHSENATDPARGQHSAFDLVRLHKFGKADADSGVQDIRDAPSFKAMVEFANAIPAVRTEEAAGQFDCLPPLTDDERAEHERQRKIRATIDSFEPVERQEVARGEEAFAGDGRLAAGSANASVEAQAVQTLARPLSTVLATRTRPRWLLKDELERGVIALLVGQRGSYKSFKALDWACRVALQGQPVYVISAEGGDFDRRAKAWVTTHAPDANLPLYVVERRLDLNSVEGIKMIRDDCLALGIHPVLFVLDTFSKLSGGLDENDNSQVRAFIGRLDNGLKRAETGFDATVLVVAHTGHSDKGRARGASALGADTDAEYIVRRQDNGKSTITVTRERFKSSPELPPLAYEPKVIDLGYTDDEGGAVTSVVLIPTDPTAIPAAKELRPEHKEALEVVYRLLMNGDMEYEDVIRGIAATLPPPVAEGDKPARDTRIQISRRRFDALEKRGYLHRRKGVGTNLVSRTAATTVGEEE